MYSDLGRHFEVDLPACSDYVFALSGFKEQLLLVFVIHLLVVIVLQQMQATLGGLLLQYTFSCLFLL